MQTSLARRQRHRRALGRRPRGRNGSRLIGAVGAIVIALFVASFIVAGFGFVVAVGAYNHYAEGLPDPAKTLQPKDWFTDPTADFVSGPVVLRHNDKDIVAAGTRDGRILLLDAASLGGAEGRCLSAMPVCSAHASSQ